MQRQTGQAIKSKVNINKMKKITHLLIFSLFFTLISGFAQGQSLDPSFYWNMQSTGPVPPALSSDPFTPNVGGGTITTRGQVGTANWPTAVAGYSGNGIIFDNRYEKIDIMTASDTYRNIDPDKGKINFWFKPTWNGVYSDSALYFFEVKHSSKFFSYIGGTGVPVQFAVNGTGNAAYYIATAANTYWDSNQWYYFEYWWNKPANGFGISISSNGAVFASGTRSGVWTWDIFFSTDHVMTIGGTSLGTGYNHCRGTMDEFSISLPSAPASINNLSALPGTEVGSLSLAWTTSGKDGASYDLPAGSQFKIQYNTSDSVFWSTASAQLALSTSVAVGTSVNWVLTGLTRGATYYARAWVRDEMNNWSGISNGATSYATPDGIVPNPITDLAAATGTNGGEINLSWTSTGDDGASGNFDSGSAYIFKLSTYAISSDAIFNISSDVAKFSPVPAPSTARTVTNITLTGLMSGVTYYFSIKAQDEQPNNSSLGNCATAYAQVDMTAPWAITDLTAVPGSVENTMVLSWTSPGDDGIAVDFTGNGSFIIKYTSGAIGSIGDTNSPARSDTNFNNAFSVSNFSPIPAANTAFIRRTMTLTGLPAGTTFYFALKTRDEVPNTSLLSNGTTNWSMYDASAPSSVTALAIFSVTSTTVLLTWPSPGDNGTTGAITNGWYWIKYTTSSTDTWDTAPYGIAWATSAPVNQAQNYLLTGLNSDTSYYIALKVGDEMPNWSDMSNPVLSRTLDITNPSATADFNAVTGNNEGEINLSWSAPGDDGTTGILQTGSMYKIQSSTWQAVAWSTGSTQINISTTSFPLTTNHLLLTSLAGGVTYYFRIWTKDEWDNYSNISNGATTYAQTDKIMPASITDLSAQPGNNEGEINLSWTSTGDDVLTGNFGAGSIFDIRYSTDILNSPAIDNAKFDSAGSASIFSPVPVPNTAKTKVNLTLTGLTAGVTYYFAIKVKDEAQNISLLENGTTSWAQADTVAPSAVADLTAGPGLAEKEIVLRWSTPGDDGTSGQLIAGSEFRIQRSTNSGQSWDINNAQLIISTAGLNPQTLASRVITGLSANTTYYFRIWSKDERGNTSAISNVTTGYSWVLFELTAPNAVTDLSYDSLGNNSLRLHWSAPGDDGTQGTAVSYLVKYATYQLTAGNFNSANNPAQQEPAPQVSGTKEYMIISGLTEGASYYFAIKTADDIPNWSGLSNVLSVKTLDLVKPVIISWAPVITSGINISTAPTVLFSENMNFASMDGRIIMKAIKDKDGNAINQAVTVTLSYSSADKRVTLTPAGTGLNSNYEYEVIVATGITDTGGNSIENSLEFTFSTLMDRTESNTFKSSDGKIKVTIPANTMTINGYIKISTNALTGPLSINPTVINTANSKIDTAGNKFSYALEGSIIEIIYYDVTDTPVTTAQSSNMEVYLAYNDSENDGIVDAVTPQVKAKTLIMYTLNEQSQAWEKLSGITLDTVNKLVKGETSHFSVFCLIGGADNALDEAYAYPVPFRPDLGDTQVTFTNLSSKATIKIYNVAGELVKTIEETDGDTKAFWDGLNEKGNKISSGLYFYYIRNDIESKKGKLLIVK